MEEKSPKGSDKEPAPSETSTEIEAQASPPAQGESAEAVAGESPPREAVQYLGFHLGNEITGVPLRQLREVAPLTAIARVPGSSPKVAGLVNVRGKIICAFDARACLGLPEASATQASIVLVLEGFDDPLGLVVDSLAGIYSVEPDRIEPPLPSWPESRARCFLGSIRLKDGLMVLIDLEKLTLP